MTQDNKHTPSSLPGTRAFSLFGKTPPQWWSEPSRPLRLTFNVLKGTAIAGAGIVAIASPFAIDQYNGFFSAPYFSSVFKGETATETVTKNPPAVGPVDKELCYDQFPEWRQRFAKQGDVVTPQAPWQEHSLLPKIGKFEIDAFNIAGTEIGPLRSPGFELGPFGGWKLPPVFERRADAGLRVLAADGQSMVKHNAQVYDDIKEVPTFLLKTLSYVEDRQILNPDNPAEPDLSKPVTVNTAINWPRTAKAIIEQGEKKFGLRGNASGGSGWQTQTFRNWAWKNNRTTGGPDKLIQLGAASTWGYRYGEDTTKARLEDALMYINTVSFGYHRGFRAGMAHYFGNTTFAEDLKDGVVNDKSALAARQLLTLVVAVQKPSDVLGKKFDEGQTRLEDLLEKMVRDGTLKVDEARRISAIKLDGNAIGKNPARLPQRESLKSVDSVVLALQKKTGMDQPDGRFRMESCDLTVKTSLDYDASKQLHRGFLNLNIPAVAEANDLVGFQRLPKQTEPYDIKYAITISQVIPEKSLALVRVSDDTFGGEHDINRDGKISPGSRHKRRMYATGSQFRADLFEELKDKSPEELRAIKVHPDDKFTRWEIDYLLDPATDKSLAGMLAATSKIVHSSAKECFFTGEGMNCPDNFKKEYGPVTEEKMIAESINLAAYRFTRQTRDHTIWWRLKTNPDIYNGSSTDPAVIADRTKLVDRYTLYEGEVHQTRGFIALYDNDKKQGKTPEEIGHILAQRSRGTTEALAVLHFSLNPDANYQSMVEYVTKECEAGTTRFVGKGKDRKAVKGPKVSCDLSDKNMAKMYDKHAPSRMVDIVSVIAQHTDRSPQALMNVHKTFRPDATYQEARQFLAAQNPAIDSFKAFTKEFKAAIPLADAQLASLIDRSPAPEIPSKAWFSQPEQLAALHGLLHPGADYKTAQAFITQNYPAAKKGADYKALHARYQAGTYDAKAVFYNFDLNDRQAMARVPGTYTLSPLWIEQGRMFIENPKISLQESLDASVDARLLAGKWIRNVPKPERPASAKPLSAKAEERARKASAGKQRAQNRAIFIMLEKDAFKEIEKDWKKAGYPFRLPATLADVIGVGGDNARSLNNFSAVLLNHGRTVYTTSFTSIDGGSGPNNPHVFHAEPGIPAPTQVYYPEVAAHVLSVARSGVESDGGTSRALKDVFKDCDGSSMTVEGKTGTNDEAKALDVRNVGWTGTFSGKFNNYFALTGDAYKYNATSKDKFTSGLMVRAIKAERESIQAVFDKACPTPRLTSMETGPLRPSAVFAMEAFPMQAGPFLTLATAPVMPDSLKVPVDMLMLQRQPLALQR